MKLFLTDKKWCSSFIHLNEVSLCSALTKQSGTIRDHSIAFNIVPGQEQSRDGDTL